MLAVLVKIGFVIIIAVIAFKLFKIALIPSKILLWVILGIAAFACLILAKEFLGIF